MTDEGRHNREGDQPIANLDGVISKVSVFRPSGKPNTVKLPVAVAVETTDDGLTISIAQVPADIIQFPTKR